VIPLVQQIPPLGVYVGLMTLPVVLYLLALFSQLPLSFIDAFRAFIAGTVASLGTLLTNAAIVAGLVLVLYCLIYLQWHRKQGLVTTGPYRFIRHPQYTGFLLFTLGLTAWSYWLLSVTWGIGWLTPEGTIALWYAELCAYIVLALIEDSYLSKQFGDPVCRLQAPGAVVPAPRKRESVRHPSLNRDLQPYSIWHDSASVRRAWALALCCWTTRTVRCRCTA